jgi:hypothetical protein
MSLVATCSAGLDIGTGLEGGGDEGGHRALRSSQSGRSVPLGSMYSNFAHNLSMNADAVEDIAVVPNAFEALHGALCAVSDDLVVLALLSSSEFSSTTGRI